ncbi:MAG: AMP-binding protein, partial [Lachnospiraceae bacterium]|nr:AMP-binding protein [Lachnospiraceae bacterium]
MTRNVIDYLNRIVNICPDKTAYSDGSVSLSFRQVYDQSRALASFLAGKGIYKKPVVIYMQKSPAEVAAFFGTVTAGNYYVPVDDTMPFDKIRMILDNVKSPLILCDDKTIGDARSQGLDKEA